MTLPEAADRKTFYGAATLMLSALLLGGGGNSAPLHNLFIQMVAIVVLALVAWQRRLAPRDRAETLALILLLLVLLTPILHIVPLPYSVWSALPGRELAVEVAALVGTTGEWRPLSLDPEASALSGLFLLAPAAMFLSVLRLGEQQRRRLAIIVIAAAILSLILGGLQVAAGAQSLRLYAGSHNQLPTGLFINRNHQADLSLIALLLSAALLTREARPEVRTWLWLAAMLLFSVGVLATSSRMGLLLLPLAILGSMRFSSLKNLRNRGATILWVGAAALASLAIVGRSAGAERTLARFQSLSDVRFEFWSDAMVAARQYFPFGSGLGTFDPVYRAIEDLNQIGPLYVNHAHNDYLELLIETGAWGCLLLFLFVVLFGWLLFRKTAGEGRQLRKAAAFSIFLLMLHSLVDYPLRMLSLLTLFGFLCALLLPVPQRDSPAKAN